MSRKTRKLFVELGKLGGKARAERLTKAERQAISSLGAKARWAKWREEKAAAS